MQLPHSPVLPVNLLAACFNSTTATYKFYWLLSILQEVENGNSTIIKKNLFARMISNAWYTVNYFHVSFGQHDKIQEAVHLAHYNEKIPIDKNLDSVFLMLSMTTNKITERQLWHFNNNVPHWFLSPWFPRIQRPGIYQASKSFDNGCLYALFNDRIEINPDWKDYLISNVRMLKDFCYWNLSLFLQTKNPSVPDIPNKLIKPATRNNLTKQRTQFWDIIIKELGSVPCIYTNNQLTVGNYAVEHFIPYNFVSHDLIWNLIPADKSFNSSKSDKLPPLEKYFLKFYSLQKTAVEIMKIKTPKNKFLEDYFSIFPDINQSFTEEKFRERIHPLITIAANNGFEFMS